MAATWRPDIAVRDINMPVMDGYELAQRLTQDELTQHTLLVAFVLSTNRSPVPPALRRGLTSIARKAVVPAFY